MERDDLGPGTTALLHPKAARLQALSQFGPGVFPLAGLSADLLAGCCVCVCARARVCVSVSDVCLCLHVSMCVCVCVCVQREAYERNVVLPARVATSTAADYLGLPC